MRESILGVKVIKAFAIENTQKSRFIEANEELLNTMAYGYINNELNCCLCIMVWW